MDNDVSASFLIREMLECDLERVLMWRNHESVRRYMYTQQEIELDEHRQWFANAAKNSTRHLFIFEFLAQPLGFVSFSEVAKGGVAEWGFYLAPDAPRGSGKLLGGAALSHAFRVLNFHKVCGEALEYNERSIKLHVAMGFQKEGVLRDQYFDGNAYHSIVCFGLLRHEWQANL